LAIASTSPGARTIQDNRSFRLIDAAGRSPLTGAKPCQRFKPGGKVLVGVGLKFKDDRRMLHLSGQTPRRDWNREPAELSPGGFFLDVGKRGHFAFLNQIPSSLICELV
jgi:hypothetical protein